MDYHAIIASENYPTTRRTITRKWIFEVPQLLLRDIRHTHTHFIHTIYLLFYYLLAAFALVQFCITDANTINGSFRPPYAKQ